jgi:hypothetical protein
LPGLIYDATFVSLASRSAFVTSQNKYIEIFGSESFTQTEANANQSNTTACGKSAGGVSIKNQAPLLWATSKAAAPQQVLFYQRGAIANDSLGNHLQATAPFAAYFEPSITRLAGAYLRSFFPSNFEGFDENGAPVTVSLAKTGFSYTSQNDTTSVTGTGSYGVSGETSFAKEVRTSLIGAAGGASCSFFVSPGAYQSVAGTMSVKSTTSGGASFFTSNSPTTFLSPVSFVYPSEGAPFVWTAQRNSTQIPSESQLFQFASF